MESILLLNNELQPQYNKYPHYNVLVQNKENVVHPFLILAIISKNDIPENIKNIYDPNKNN